LDRYQEKLSKALTSTMWNQSINNKTQAIKQWAKPDCNAATKARRTSLNNLHNWYKLGVQLIFSEPPHAEA